MSQNMLRKILEKLLIIPANALGIVYDLLKKIAGEPGEWLPPLKKFLRKENPCWPAVEKAVEKSKQSLLELVDTVELPTIEEFVVNDHIQYGEVVDGVRWWLGPDFIRIFGNATEDAQPPAKLRVWQLTESSVDDPIIAELGGKEIAVTTIGRIHQIMTQPNGEPGELLTGGLTTIFYVFDAEGVLWAVDCYRNVDYVYMGLGAHPVSDSYLWRGDFRVVSR